MSVHSGMRLFVLLVLFSAALETTLASFVPLPYAFTGLFGHRKPLLQAEVSEYERYFNQTTDQFNYKDKYHYQNYVPIFKQRYFVNTQWKGNQYGNVHLLYLEGENTADPSMVTDTSLPHVALAKEVGATLWSLEHRFRGKSQPFRRTFHNNYNDYLSAGAAIADVANFINQTNQNSSMAGSNPKWVVVGQGYAGVLALWFRQLYPSLSVGVVAEAAAVIPTTDFYNYEKFVEEVYSNYSYDCWHGIKFSALAIRNELQYASGISFMNSELKPYPKIGSWMDYKNFQHLHHNIIGLFEIPVLYNKVNIGPFATTCGVADACAVMSSRKGRDIDRVYDLARLIYTNTHGGKENWPGIDNSYELMVKWLNSTRHAPEDTEQPSARSWLFQLCHEFGQFITTDSGSGLFRSTVPNDYWIGICTDSFEEKIFSYTVDNLKDGIRNTIKAFNPQQTYNGSNAIIFNGGFDPYTLLSVNSVSDPSSRVFTVPGVGHGAVLRPPTTTDPAKLTEARNKVLRPTVKKWLSSASRNSQVIKTEVEEKESKPQEEAIVFPEIKRYVTSIHYPKNDKPRHPWRYPTDEEVQRKRYFPFGNSIHQQMDKHHRKKMKASNNVKVGGTGADTKKNELRAGYVDQDVDHFDSTCDLVFQQRFFKNNFFQQDKDSPRFLLIGGEAALTDTLVEDDYLHYFRWAKDFKAIMYALEHRFFGYSQPFGNSSTYLLVKYLNTEQVLADTAVFVQTMNSVENNTNPKWILFGGSYAANLVAIFRLRYPQLTLGGIASSAPMKAKTDFFEYTQQLERDIHKYGVENTHSQYTSYLKRCPNAARRFFAFIRKYINSRTGRSYLKNGFCIENRWDENYIDENDAGYFPIEWIYKMEYIMENDDEAHRDLTNLCMNLYYIGYYYGDVQRRSRKLMDLEVKHGSNSTIFLQKLKEEQSWMVKARRKMAERKQGAQLDMFPTPEPASKRISKREAKMPATAVKAADYYQYKDEDSDNYHDYDDSQETSSGYVGEEVVCPRYCYNCIRVSYNQYLENLEDIYRHCVNGSYCSDQSRLWLWLQCTQWGFMQSTNYGYNIFGSSLPVNFALNLCTDVFGKTYNRTYVDAVVARTNKAYGGADNYNGTNVMFINGGEDPWSTLSVYQPLQPQANVTSILVPGVSHCADMKREDVHDAQELKDARKQIKKQIVRWVRRANGPKTEDV